MCKTWYEKLTYHFDRQWEKIRHKSGEGTLSLRIHRTLVLLSYLNCSSENGLPADPSIHHRRIWEAKQIELFSTVFIIYLYHSQLFIVAVRSLDWHVRRFHSPPSSMPWTRNDLYRPIEWAHGCVTSGYEVDESECLVS